MNALLDTNVLIDYLGGQPPFYENAQKIVCAAYFGDIRLWVSTGSLKDAFYVLNRYTDSEKIQRAILKTCEAITPVALSAEDSLHAAKLLWEDYEDCLIALSAEKAKAEYIITRDALGFSRASVPIISPEAFVKLLAERGFDYGEVKF